MTSRTIIDLTAYAFCEPATVATAASWCLRKVTSKGRKYGGGVDTTSLCGRVDPARFGGWDLEVPVDEGHLNLPGVVCTRCLAILLDGAVPEPVSRYEARALQGRKVESAHHTVHALTRVGSESALCGAKPGQTSAGWSEPQKQVTCDRCLRQLKARGLLH